MSEPWYLLPHQTGTPAFNMALDELLLENVDAVGRPLLRFYGWDRPAATFGYFQKYAEIEALTRLRPLIRRPTGGGLVPHDGDWTYSLVAPPGHFWYSLKAEESYERIHRWIRAAFHELNLETRLSPTPLASGPGQCFVGAEKFDLLFDNRKVAGAAQRRNRRGLLIQGSIQHLPPGLNRPDWERVFRSLWEFPQCRDWAPFPGQSELERQARALAASKYETSAFNRKR